MEEKTTKNSITEISRLIKFEDINGFSRLFGGKLMQWMDEVAGICAMRHCGGIITTAAVDNLQFKKGAGIGDIIVLTAKATYVGNTSMEVRVDVYNENKETGQRTVINRAYFTEVHINEKGEPIPIKYKLKIETPSEEAEWEGAKKRIAMRKERRGCGY
ncbi:MAG TPA: acyl-CoA thioesterase [Lachnospiraceae bacterium]|nr:acyl-CoA thioesterase [Lachnospiraceae bacterium]